MKRNRLLKKKDLLSISLNTSNVVNIDTTESYKENVAARGLAIISVTKAGNAINKDIFDDAVEKEKVKKIKSLAKGKRLSNNANSQSSEDNEIKIGDVIIPKKVAIKRKILLPVNINGEITETKKVVENETFNEIKTSVISSKDDDNKFKTPGMQFRNKKSVSSISSSTMASPILASSPIISVKHKNSTSSSDDFLSTSIIASSDNPANSKTSLRTSFISPIKKNRSVDNKKLSQKYRLPQKQTIRRRQSAPSEMKKPIITRYGRTVHSFADSVMGKYIFELYSQSFK